MTIDLTMICGRNLKEKGTVNKSRFYLCYLFTVSLLIFNLNFFYIHQEKIQKQLRLANRALAAAILKWDKLVGRSNTTKKVVPCGFGVSGLLCYFCLAPLTSKTD